jgi:hypothetical protein
MTMKQVQPVARRLAIVLTACAIIVVSCGSDDTSGDAVPLPFMVELQGGVPYTLAQNVLDDSLSFTNQTDGTYAFQDDGSFVLAADSHLAEPLVTLFDASEARMPADPLFDLSTIGPDPSALDREPLTLPAPADAMFDYVARLPGVTTGLIEDATIAGLPAKAMTYSFADPGGGAPCFDSPRGPCIFLAIMPGATPGSNERLLFNYWAEDSGTVYTFEHGGHQIFVDVSDRDGAADVAATLSIGNAASSG